MSQGAGTMIECKRVKQETVFSSTSTWLEPPFIDVWKLAAETMQAWFDRDVSGDVADFQKFCLSRVQPTMIELMRGDEIEDFQLNGSAQYNGARVQLEVRLFIRPKHRRVMRRGRWESISLSCSAE